MKSSTAELIKSLRKSRKLTQEQLGLLSGMTKSQVCKMESGQLGSEETVDRLLDAMGYAVELKVVDRLSSLSTAKQRLMYLLGLFKKYNSDHFGIVRLALLLPDDGQDPSEEGVLEIMVRMKKPSIYLYAELKSSLESVIKQKVYLIPESSSRFSHSGKAFNYIIEDVE